MFINSYQAEWAYFTGAVVTLFFIIDPIAAVPIYMTITERFNEQDRRMIRRKASLIALGLLSFVAVSGSRFFALFNITLPAFQIAGGILLLNIGMAQLNAVRRRVQPAEEGESLHRDDISVSIDIADIDVGDNIGARLQADQAEADMRIARAKAEERRARAVAAEQEMKALTVENQAKVVLAEAEIPLAMADAYRSGYLRSKDSHNGSV